MLQENQAPPQAGSDPCKQFLTKKSKFASKSWYAWNWVRSECKQLWNAQFRTVGREDMKRTYLVGSRRRRGGLRRRVEGQRRSPSRRRKATREERKGQALQTQEAERERERERAAREENKRCGGFSRTPAAVVSDELGPSRISFRSAQ
jgi:hypothetical protein